MPDVEFNTAKNTTISRDMLVLYLNTGTGELPVWSPVGIRVADSSMELDWQRETSTDILGKNYSSMKEPVITQTFDPWPLSNGDVAQKAIWNKAIKDHDAKALASMDMMLAHMYAGTADTAVFAERYSSCAVEATGLGGEGGGDIAMPVSVTFGGTRTVGTAAVTGGEVKFSPAA